MKILTLNNTSNPFRTSFVNRSFFSSVNNQSINNKNLSGDIVVFRAKNYDIESIVNPTNHCAYCGCKVYSEAQLDSLAKSMLSSKSHRLQGDIKSVLEKLESAVRSDELTFAKKVENREEIDFFKKLQKFAEDKSFLKGEAIFQQVYNLQPEEAFQLLKRNLRPLTKTVDHVSPQNLDEDNNNADINLVEACYCCNHDLKKGMSFPEFYAMFPSIKENMPPDKFQYAHSNLMSSSASSILSRMSATNLLKYVQRLFGQREETVSRLASIDFRISEANSSVDASIQSCKDEIAAKQAEIKSLQCKLDALASDDEYQALVARIQMNNQREQLTNIIQSLRDRRSNVSNALNDLRNPPKKAKKSSKVQMSLSEKEAKIADYKKSIIALNSEIELQESKKDDLDLQIMELDEKFPTLESLQSSKSKVDAIISAHMKLASENVALEQLNNSLLDCQQKIAILESQILQYPKIEFDPSLFSEEEQILYQRYLTLVEAAKYIETHSSGNSMKAIINFAAKSSIDSEISELLQSNIVMSANCALKIKELQCELDSLRKQELELKKQISSSKKNIENYRRITEGKTLEDAKDNSQRLSVNIRRITDKQSYIKLPSVISSLKAEIILLESTIKDLESRRQEIQKLNEQKS